MRMGPSAFLSCFGGDNGCSCCFYQVGQFKRLNAGRIKDFGFVGNVNSVGALGELVNLADTLGE